MSGRKGGANRSERHVPTKAKRSQRKARKPMQKPTTPPAGPPFVGWTVDPSGCVDIIRTGSPTRRGEP